MKKTRLYINGRRQNDVYLGRTKWEIFKYKTRMFLLKMFRLSMLGLALYVAFLFGRYTTPAEQIINTVQASDTIAPVLERIAKCESGGKHYDKNGQVLMRSNTNKTVDLGKYQLNTVWFAKATELGLDITKEADNEKMAEWIFENKGSSAWNASSKCWNK